MSFSTFVIQEKEIKSQIRFLIPQVLLQCVSKSPSHELRASHPGQYRPVSIIPESSVLSRRDSEASFLNSFWGEGCPPPLCSGGRWRQVALAPVPTSLGGKTSEGLHLGENGGRGLLLWAMGRGREGGGRGGGEFQAVVAAPRLWEGRLGPWLPSAGSVSILRFLELPSGWGGGTKSIPTTQKGSIFSNLPPTTSLASVPVSVHPPPTHLWGLPITLTGGGAGWWGVGGSRDQRGWEAALSMGPGWAAPWASMDALGTRGRATMAGGGHFSQVLTLWWGLSTGEATPSFLSFTPPPRAPVLLRHPISQAKGRCQGQRLRAWRRPRVLQRKGKGLQEGTACAKVGCAGADLFP